LILAAASIVVGAAPASAAASARCHTGDLYVSLASSSGAAGHVVYVFGARNMSGKTCHLSGYFGVTLLGERGRPMDTRVKRVKRDVAGAQPRKRVTLRAGQSGSFRISTAIGSGHNCVHATALRAGAPRDRARLTVLLGKRDIVACDHGRIFVGPIQPGNGAKPK
jgi:hypothetical protein